MTTTVQFGALSMVGGRPSDGQYVVHAPFFDAWYSVPDSKAEVRERPSADGAFGIDRDWRASLALPMDGRFRGPNWAAMLTALQTAASTGVQVSVTVSDELGVSTRSVNVRRFKPRPMPGADLCYFEMDLLAVDGRRYGPLQSPSAGLAVAGTGQPWPQTWPADWGSGGTDGRVTAVNTGSAPTSPLLTVSGGLGDGVQLVEVMTGSYLQLDRVIPVGSAVFFDSRTSRAYLDDPANDVSGFLSRRDWEGFQIPAGATRTVQFNGLGAATGTPLLTVNYSPAN